MIIYYIIIYGIGIVQKSFIFCNESKISALTNLGAVFHARVGTSCSLWDRAEQREGAGREGRTLWRTSFETSGVSTLLAELI